MAFGAFLSNTENMGSFHACR